MASIRVEQSTGFWRIVNKGLDKILESGVVHGEIDGYSFNIINPRIIEKDNYIIMEGRMKYNDFEWSYL